jgi:hypothetical protein
MKSLSACFYASLRCLFPKARVLFQSASLKLNFADVASFLEQQPSCPLATYAQRKKTAVSITKKLVSGPLPPRLAVIFAKSKKKDDLSDALLHALAGLCVHSQHRCPKAKAKPKAKSRAQSMDDVGAST